MSEVDVEKLCRWAGFKKANIKEHYHYESGKRVADWLEPCGVSRTALPRIDLSVDFCFEFLVPEAQTDFNILFREIHWVDGTILTQCELTLDSTRRITSRPVIGRIKDKAALALCKAFESLAKEERGGF